MGNPTGFLEIEKKEKGYEDPINRIKHFKEFLVPLDTWLEWLSLQARMEKSSRYSALYK